MSLTDKAITRIRELIQSGELPPGSRLPPEQQLAAELGRRSCARRHASPSSSTRTRPRRQGVAKLAADTDDGPRTARQPATDLGVRLDDHDRVRLRPPPGLRSRSCAAASGTTSCAEQARITATDLPASRRRLTRRADGASPQAAGRCCAPRVQRCRHRGRGAVLPAVLAGGSGVRRCCDGR